jgi:hypothetical protein
VADSLDDHHQAEEADGLWAQCKHCGFMTARVSADRVVHLLRPEDGPAVQRWLDEN